MNIMNLKGNMYFTQSKSQLLSKNIFKTIKIL